MIERIAKSVPKPCYALEFDLSSEICQKCEVQKQCFEALGARRTKVNLGKVAFKLVPAAYNLDDTDMGEDPELPQLERTYILCHQTIFGCRPKDKIGRYKALVIKKFRQTNGSLRLFMLANMISHQQREVTIAKEMCRQPKNYFSAVLLSQDQAIKRFEECRAMCRKEFGSFDLGSLESLTEVNYAENDIEKKMLRSEITAAIALVNYKIHNGGSGFASLYLREELSLDPYWLATEATYYETVLKPHLAGEKSTPTVNNHRFSVSQVLSQMKRQKDWGIAVFQARERAMPKAVEAVLHHWGFVPGDFEIENEPVTSMLDFWVWTARAIQHVNCLRYAAGEYSVFKR